MSEPQPRMRIVRLLQRWWPWLVGVAIVGLIATRVPLAAFRDAMTKGPHLVLAMINLALVSLVLASDAVATWIGLRAVRLRRPLGNVLAVRGATFLLFLVNYALGQGGFGYYLHRTGTPTLRAAGATLFLLGTTLATLILLSAIAFAVTGADAVGATMWWTLWAACAGFGLYLIVIAARPQALARRELFAPLFDAGVRGHAITLLGRLPNVIITVLGPWVAMRAWGIPVPFAVGATAMPAVTIATVLPISPAGLGTTQAAMVFFFADYAPGASAELRSASVLAFGIVHFVYGVGASLLVGLVCMPFAKRTGAVPDTRPVPPADVTVRA